jgi:hypothetical protein
VHLREGWFKPGVVVIVEYGLSGVVLVRPVASDIRRIGEDKVDAAIGMAAITSMQLPWWMVIWASAAS